MRFKEDHCAIIYPGKDKCPDFYSTGVNVVAECRGGTVSFRKDPTGIVIYEDECQAKKMDKCIFCRHFQYNPLFNQEDLENSVRYIQEKMFAAMGIPKKYLRGGDG